MIYHSVWFKMKEGSSEADRVQLQSGLRALIPVIPEIVELAAGDDFSTRSRGYEVGLLVKCLTKADLDVYAVHPEHLKFIASHKHLWQDVLALDFEA